MVKVTNRHETLRTIFPADPDGTPHQRILYEAAPQLTTWDFTQEALAEAAADGFDITSEPPIRAHLFTAGPNEHVLLIVLHHIAGDGWSLAPLARDVITAYAGQSLAPLKVQYADYTLWQHELFGSEDDPESLISRQLAYWTETLADLPDQLELPTDRPRPAEATYRGSRVPVRIDSSTLAGLHREIGRAHV